ncbi:MAG TPA: InlB B-repeat-containing protein, partial [Chitinispirillaceae bacterium]|nr:InlB B-repeat-containing protein [Chitinispirillaceae bacterium]
MSNHKMQRSEKRVLFFVLSILVLSAGLFLHCFHGPTSGLPTYLEITGVNLSGAPDIRTFFVGDKISVRIEVLEVEPVDSIVFAIIKNPSITAGTEESLRAAVDTVLHRGEIGDKNFVTFCPEEPGIFLLGAYGRSKDTISIDTVYVKVFEKVGTNQPVVHVKLVRPYCAPSLPCSVKVSYTKYENWQTVKLLSDSMDQDIICKDDSLCIWKPAETDTSKTHELRIVTIDNGLPPTLCTTTVAVTVIRDSQPPPAVQNLRVAERSDAMVKLVWDMDSLVDTYTVLRSQTAGALLWETVGKSILPEFTDMTDTAFIYRVIAHNYFGTTASVTDIVGRDTIHYAHTIGFEKVNSITSENDSVCSIRVKVSQAAKMPITVGLSVGGTVDSNDYSLPVKQVVINSGDSTAAVVLRIVNDEIAEQPESLVVSIDSVSSGYMSGLLKHTVTIADNDTFYTVSFNGNGAESGTVPDSGSCKRGVMVTVQGNTGTLKRAGHTFTGWNTLANGDGNAYLAGDKFVMPAAAVLLYARWTPNSYNVTFDKNDSGATGSMLALPIVFGTTVNLTANGCAKTGHSFAGWATSSGGNVVYGNGAEFRMTTEGATLYAKWTPNSYNVTFNKNDAGATGSMGAQSIVFGTTVNLTANGYAKTGHSFAGWATSSGGSAVYGNGAAFTMTTEGDTLYAKWTPITYTITYNLNGGTNGNNSANYTI